MPTQTNSHARLWAFVAAFCATLISLPGSAVTIPDNPLQTGTAYPPPNILFILDNSGSMELTTMPDDPAATSGINIADLAYTRNGLSYNPNLDYKPWIQSNNTRLTGGTSYTAAYSDLSLASGSTTNLSNNDQIFYVPISQTDSTDYDKASGYYMYLIPAGGTTMLKGTYGTSNWGQFKPISGFAKTGLSAAATYTYTVTQPGTTGINFSLSGGSNSGKTGADLQLINPSNTVVCNSAGNNNNESCAANNPVAGVWTIKVIQGKSFSNVSLDGNVANTDNRCYANSNWTAGKAAFVDCVAERPIVDRKDGTPPAARSLSDELKNYATWYSYARTRMKTAKSGASEAFSRLSTNMRVGFDTIWGKNRAYTDIVFRIPVGTNGGLFQGANRDTWFTQVQAADGSNNTPLHGALSRAGKYFSETGSTGPWGPETGANQISCRQNFALLTTDGYWNNQSGYPLGAKVGDSDKTAGTVYTSANGLDALGYVPETPFIDNSSSARADTLADVANYYWKTDLRDLPNNVPKSDEDKAFWQHMTTFGISIGLKGNLDPKLDLNGLVTGGKRWGDPLDTEDEDRIDDLWHASLNGHGDFVVAKDPTEFARALVDALSTVEARDGSASNVTANSTSFISGARIYQARYVSGKWTGELAAYDASKSGTSASAVWNGSQGIPASGRKVFTWTGAAGATFPTPSQVTSLARTTGVAPINGTDNAAYIKGDRSKEIQNAGDQRNRDSLLGDIVNSSPTYVTDTNTIYVGANDGMLHAFDAGDADTTTTTDGKELWAYVPAGINFAQLANYSDPQYAHRYFVDGSVVVSNRKQTPGSNILVGALGRGGKGLYALDVTNPTTFAAANAKWEIGGTDADMGQVLGDPLIVTLNDVAQTKAVIVSNGPNSTNGNSVLFVINLQTGAVIKKLSTGVGSDNGLSEPRGRDIDGNGTVDYVYAGDLKGNLWKFDLTAANSTTWNIPGNRPMYKTRTGQAITAGVAIARNPTDGRAWVFFGTGRYLEYADNSDNTVQAMYGVQDLNDGLTVGESEIQSRAIVTYQDVDKSDRDLRTFEKNAPLPAGKKGWFILLNKPDTGERIIVRPQMRGAIVVASSMVPPVASTCEAGGKGWLNAIDAFTGTATSEAYFDTNGDGKFTNADKLADPTGTMVGVSSIATGGGAPTKGVFIENTMFYSKTNGGKGSEVTNGGGGLSRRVQWREILQD